jgi:hypothetical protein
MKWDPSVLGSENIHSDIQPPTVLILPTSKFMKIAYFKDLTAVPKINTIQYKNRPFQGRQCCNLVIVLPQEMRYFTNTRALLCLSDLYWQPSTTNDANF